MLSIRLFLFVAIISTVFGMEQRGADSAAKSNVNVPVGFFREIIYNFIFLAGAGLAICELIMYCLQGNETAAQPTIYGRFTEEVVGDHPQPLNEDRDTTGPTLEYLNSILTPTEPYVNPLKSNS